MDPSINARRVLHIQCSWFLWQRQRTILVNGMIGSVGVRRKVKPASTHASRVGRQIHANLSQWFSFCGHLY